MPIIRADAGFITQINAFTVPEGGQQPLIDLLVEVGNLREDYTRLGFRDIYRSLDGTRVVNYAQSENMDAARNIIERLREGGFFARNTALGEAHPGLYEVVRTLDRDA